MKKKIITEKRIPENDCRIMIIKKTPSLNNGDLDEVKSFRKKFSFKYGKNRTKFEKSSCIAGPK